MKSKSESSRSSRNRSSDCFVLDLKTASKTKSDDIGSEAVQSAVKYCFDLEPECSRKCIDFDKQQRFLSEKKGLPVPCSVDAIMKSNDDVYAIEFKTGRIDMVNVHRKIYDTVLSWIENKGRSVAHARERVVYVLVLASLSKDIKRYGRFLLGMKRPWEKLPIPSNLLDLKKLQGWLVRRVEIMPPEFFKRYIGYYKI